MSAIFGEIYTDNKPITTGDMALMADCLNHWHADKSGSYIKNHIGFGHLMLYNTVGSKTETLPLYNSELLITADARIDNRDEICKALGLTDDETQNPDSKLILYLYQKHKEACVQYLVGDFAFVIWDERAKKIFCARDHMGVKPLFYYHKDNIFAFASEKKGLLIIPGVDKTIDEAFLYGHIIGLHDQNAISTLYKHIKRLPAAHRLTLDLSANKTQTDRYWVLDAHATIKLAKKEDYYEGLRHHFDEAVKCRLRSAYTIGAELSGGLDSSAIVGAASKFTNSRLITFSNTTAIGITDEEELHRSERKYIEAVIEHNNIRDSVFVTKNAWGTLLDEIDFGLEVNDGLEVWAPMWQIGMKQAAMQKGVRVLLSGFPGDEMVTYKGQHHYLAQLERKEYIAYLKNIGNKNGLISILKPLIPVGLEYGLHKINNALSLYDKRMRQASSAFHIPVKYRMMKRDAIWTDEIFRQRYKSYKHYQISRLLKPMVELRLEAETRFGLYSRLETRFPMADIRLTQFYLSMPDELKYHAEINRHAYRQSVKDYLPDIVMNRLTKIGNLAPFWNKANRLNERKIEIEKIREQLQENGDLPLKLKSTYNPTAAIEILRWLSKTSFPK